jgi:hypothetical protein
MIGFRYLRYAVLLFAAIAYANGPSSIEAASNRLPSCDECDENTPCETECNGTYAEEPWETTCGAHRNWGGECAGQCQDDFCDPWENPTNCCQDCDPWGCGPEPCEPDWVKAQYGSETYAEEAFISNFYYDFTQECWAADCYWRAWHLYVMADWNECEESSEPFCDYENVPFRELLGFCANSPSEAKDECEDYMFIQWTLWPYGTPEVCE